MGALGRQFRDFLLKQNALALAVGVIIGAAVGKVVSALVEDILMPIIGLVMPGGEWRAAQFNLSANSALKYGDLLGKVLDFCIVAAVVFLIVKLFLTEKVAEAPKTKVCTECLEVIPEAARRCRACASPQVG